MERQTQSSISNETLPHLSERLKILKVARPLREGGKKQILRRVYPESAAADGPYAPALAGAGTFKDNQ
jgi:hypothetical protein